MKRFYENTIMSGAFSKALRVLALLCVLMGFSASGWGATLPGSFNNWTADGSTVIDNGYTIYLNAGTYEFKIESGGTWYGCNTTINESVSGYEFKSGDDNKNCKLNATVSGNYTFKLDGWNGSNPKLAVTYPPSYGFFTDGAWNIKVGDKWSNDNNGNGYGATGNSDIQLGTVAAGTSLGFWAKTFKSSGSELCAPKVGIKIEGVDTDYTLYDLEWKEDLNDAKTDQLWLKDKIVNNGVSYTIPSTLTEGKEYELRVYFQLQVKENGNCATKDIFLNNGRGNFRLKFTVGSSGGGGGGGSTGTDFDFVLDTKTNNFGGWIANGEVYAIFRENEGGKTGETRQVQLEICESDNRLAYYNGTTTFTRTDGTTWTPKEVYVYSGGGNDAFAKWDGTKNCMVITNWGLMTNNSGGCTMTTFSGDCDGTSGGGGGGGDDSPYISFDCLYLNTGGSTLWNLTSETVNFYLYLYNDTKGTKKSVKATVCPDASDIFYAEVPDGEWEGYLWIRKDANNNTDPAVNWNSAGVKDQTDNCSIYKDLTTITGWENANFTNGTYSGSCGCAGGGGDIDDDTEEYVKGTSVLLSYEADERTADNWVLSAFLEATCAVEDITEYGFFLCETTKEGGCKPTAESYTYRVDATTKTPLEKYGSFTGIASGLSNAWYGYRAFVVADGETILSPNTKYFNNKCKYELTGDTVYVTIDNSLTVNNECELKFKSIKDAWTTLKTLPEVCKAEKVTYGWKQDKITLIKPVVMQLVPTGINYVGFEKVGLTGGDMTTVQATFFRNINMSGGAPLIVRSIDYLTKGARATLQHVAIRRSKNITLNYLNIVGASRDVESADNAIDIDNGVGSGNLEGLGTDWNCASISAEDNNINANIVIKNCEIVSYGFTCVHVSAYNGITFENNEFKAMYDFVEADKLWKDEKNKITWADNTANWGASAKFLNSKNISFIRNNFTGQHATSILLQGTQKVLIYDNVFWHDNGVNTDANTVAIIRLISFGDCAGDNPLQNIGIYYNTMFLKNNTVGKGYYHHFDFFRLGGSQQTGNTGNYKPATIEFDYNNCYSYDTDVYGKNFTDSDNYSSSTTRNYLQTMDEDDWCGSFKYNNFWSVYDEKQKPKPTRSAFALGSGCNSDEGKNNFINVQNLVCKTSPEEPGSLVIKGNELNIGAFIQTDVSGLLTDKMQMIDRLGNARPYDPTALQGKGSYTLGAYQKSTGEELQQIIWNGSASNDWDNRNNWYKPNGQLVTCVDVLSENLEVVIPSPRSTKYPIPALGIKNYPILPEGISTSKFEDGTRSEYAGYGEEVSAGKGKTTPTQMAKTISMEYGAALVGIEELASGRNRYDEVNSTLVTPRDKWILVGTVVEKWKDDSKTEVRNLLSIDYYMNNYPHVYMHQAVKSGNTVAWNNPFADLTIPVPADEVYAINVADEYGYYKLTAATYYTALENNPNMVDDGSRPKTISFSGRFLNDKSLPNYGTLNAGVNNLICNTYPANIDVEKLLSAVGGTVQIYNYSKESEGSFQTVTSGVILSQHGFVLSPTKTGEVILPRSVFRNDSTNVRSSMVALPKFRLVVKNIAEPKSSNVLISIDDLKEDVINYSTDAPKLYNSTDKKLPELYVMRYDKDWSGIAIPTMEEPIPVGVKTFRNNVSVKFSLRDVENMGTIILEDRMQGKSYNLTLGEECVIEALPKGVTEGRFFLNLTAAPEEDEHPEEEGGDDVTTEVEDEIVSESGISIIGNTQGIVVSSSADIELQTIIVNDMSGKSAAYKVSGQYAEIKLPVAQGVYTVNVIGDTASKTGKVILK